MADLKALIRLRQHRIDEKQKALAELYRQSEQMESRKVELILTLEKEKMIAQTSELKDASAYYGRYSRGVRLNIEKIEKDLLTLETRIQIAQDDIRESFAELKRVEIVQRTREEKERKKQADKESAELDEIGIDVFRRQDKF